MKKELEKHKVLTTKELLERINWPKLQLGCNRALREIQERSPLQDTTYESWLLSCCLAIEKKNGKPMVFDFQGRDGRKI